MLPYCELICHWVRVKMCVLRCFEVCGLPQEKVAEVNLQQFARAIVQLASNEKLLRRVVDAVSCGDGDDVRTPGARYGPPAECLPSSLIMRRHSKKSTKLR